MTSKRKPTPLAIPSKKDEFPPICKEKQLHRFEDSYVRFTFMSDKEFGNTRLDTFFVPVCVICKEVKRE